MIANKNFAQLTNNESAAELADSSGEDVLWCTPPMTTPTRKPEVSPKSLRCLSVIAVSRSGISQAVQQRMIDSCTGPGMAAGVAP